MAHLPTPVLDYLNHLTVEDREPAFLLVNHHGNLIGWGGPVDAYGISDLRAGEPAGELISFLEGMFPLESKRIALPCIETGAGRPAELHLFPAAEGDYAILLDARTQERQQKLMQQKGNEQNLSYQRLIKEVQKKEILLHSIVHDLGEPLMGIKGGFEFLANEEISAQGREFLEIGLRQVRKQEELVGEILRAFAAEVESLETFSIEPEQAPDLLLAANTVSEALSPAFALNEVELLLELDPYSTGDWKVIGEQSRLERVISNLMENALRYTPAHSTVTFTCHDEGDKVLATIDDQGPGIPPELADSLFQKIIQSKKGRGRIGLGLYFCRIMIENWGGEIGHLPLEHGGTRFWFRLPRPRGN
jgi:signal transduction histidine kinase